MSGFSLLHSRSYFVRGEDFAVSTIRDTIFFVFVLGNSKMFINFIALLTLVLSLDVNLFGDLMKKDTFTFN